MLEFMQATNSLLGRPPAGYGGDRGETGRRHGPWQRERGRSPGASDHLGWLGSTPEAPPSQVDRIRLGRAQRRLHLLLGD